MATHSPSNMRWDGQMSANRPSLSARARAARVRRHCASENGICRWLTSQHSGARVVLEYFGVADVAAQRLDRSVARLVHQLEDRGPALGRARQKPGSHRVPRE